MEMPEDANGKTIDIAKCYALFGGDGKLLMVDSYVYSVEKDGVWSIIDSEGNEYACESLLIDPPDSWKQLEWDVKNLSPFDYVGRREIDTDIALGSAMAQDVYRRARALAGGAE